MAQMPDLSEGPIRIRNLRDTPADLAHMARWLTDPLVLAYYEGRDNPFPEARIRSKYIEGKGPEEHPCIVELGGQPIGYIQFYPVKGDDLRSYGLDPLTHEAIWGMDQFIGEPSLWGQGIGRRMIRMVLRHLFTQAGADRVVLDPVVTNYRAIRAYERCGFQKAVLLSKHELHEGEWRDCWRMEVTPGTFR